jgi:hypothetical protein
LSIGRTTLDAFLYDNSDSFSYFILFLFYNSIIMSTLKTNVTFICNDKDLNPEEKLQAIEAEVQQTLYSEEEYDEAVYGK